MNPPLKNHWKTFQRKAGDNMLRILVAEADSTTRTDISDTLKKQGYEVYEIAGGYEMLKTFHSDFKIDMIVLNTKLNEMSGIELCKIVNRPSDIPILFISDNPSTEEEIKCFEAGATDYMHKPVNLDVFTHRVYVALTRYSSKEKILQSKTISFDELIINNSAHEVTINDTKIELTSKEYRVIFKLTANIGRVYTREQLLDDIWGYDYEGTARSVDTLVARLRKKLGAWGDKHFKTVFGTGYKVE